MKVKCRNCIHVKPPNPNRRWRRIKITHCAVLRNCLSLPKRVKPDIDRECTTYQEKPNGKTEDI